MEPNRSPTPEQMIAHRTPSPIRAKAVIVVTKVDSEEEKSENLVP